jgi:tellurite resistance protein TerC
MESIGSPGLWIGFVAFVIAMIALDLGVFHRRAHAIGFREAAIWTAVWVALSAVFAAGVWLKFGGDRGLEFVTGYLIEKALAVDNIFVFVVVFSTFAVPVEHQHRVLLWGILGALLMRAIFIFAGVAFLERFHYAIYVFGGLLVVTGAKLLLTRDKVPDPQKNPLVRLFRRLFPVMDRDDSGSFVVRHRGRLFATPLLLALVSVEVTDIVFAIDSIPAIFAVTTDPFIVFTSNIFAILGLRSLYFLLATAVGRFHLLKVGLSFVLMFVGAKMLLAGVVHVPIWASLTVILGLLAASIVASLLWPRDLPPVAGAEGPPTDGPGASSAPQANPPRPLEPNPS